MKRKIIIRLLLLVAVSIFLYSCMNEDLYSSFEKEKHEIQSKSLWKEDMVFITNVKEIFLKNVSLENFKTNHGGLPQWEYAMTFGNFDESYLMVPVFGEDKVTGVVTVKRIEDMVYFKFSKDEKAKSFFSHLISSENKKLTPVKEIAENAKIICTSRTYNLCFPNNDGTQDCYPQMVVKCISEDGFEDNDIGGDNSDNGLPYGGGGNGNNNPQQPNYDIINNLQGYPCAQNLALELPNLKNELATSMKQIFQNNKNYNITFKPGYGLGTIDGETFSTSSSEFNSFNATITLNDQVLLHATKEYILVTMYHEVIHAFLRYEKFRLGDAAFHDQYPSVIVGYDYAPNGTVINRFTFIDGHQQLIPFLTSLQNIISAYNPNLSHDVVVAIARAGITTMTPEQSELNKNERNTLLGKQKGSTCL